MGTFPEEFDELAQEATLQELLAATIAGGGGGSGGAVGGATEATLEELVALATGGIRAVRRDADTVLGTDGQPQELTTNSVGRLKVSALPEVTVATTGNITANAQSVTCDVARASNVMIQVTGTFAGVNLTFEVSIDGGTTWLAAQAVRTNANTIEATSGVIGAAPAYGWELSVNACTHVRVRATAFTSGTVAVRILPGAFATEPVPAVPTHAVTGSGTFTVAGAATVTPVTPSTYNAVTTAAVLAAFMKASAGSLYELTVFNPTGAPIFVKLYNKATAPVPASDTPITVIPVEAGKFYSVEFGVAGKRFATGISIGVTGAVANTDTTAVAAGVLINASYL